MHYPSEVFMISWFKKLWKQWHCDHRWEYLCDLINPYSQESFTLYRCRRCGKQEEDCHGVRPRHIHLRTYIDPSLDALEEEKREHDVPR
jgi:hypothetical protein